MDRITNRYERKKSAVKARLNVELDNYKMQIEESDDIAAIEILMELCQITQSQLNREIGLLTQMCELAISEFEDHLPLAIGG